MSVRWTAAFVYFAVLSSNVVLPAVVLNCDNLQNVCDDDERVRMCVCNSTGNTLAWSTSQTGQSTLLFGATNPVGRMQSLGDFTAILTTNGSGMLSSKLTFSPPTVNTNGVMITCQDAGLGSSLSSNIEAATPPDPPGVRQLESPIVSCDPNNETSQVTLQWNDGDTGGPDVNITRYMVEVTGPPEFMCLSQECIVTTNITTITGLDCSSDYSFSVRAINCNGSSDPSDHVTIKGVSAPMITRACRNESHVFLDWTDTTGSDSFCSNQILNYYVNSTIRTENVEKDVTSIVIDITSYMNDMYNIILRANSECGSSNELSSDASGYCDVMTSAPTTNLGSEPTVFPTPSPTPPGKLPVMDISAAAGGGGAAAAVVALLVIVIKSVLICIFCPCACCMPCRRKCCGCCPEEWICCHCGRDDTDGEPVPIVDKGPVVKNKEVETGQPSYPSYPPLLAMYQDPSTIERKAAPTTGDLYAQPDRPARHQQQQAVELPTYQDPSTIQRQTAPTGDMYALPDKIPKQPSGPAPALYTEVDKTNQTGTMYAELDHTGNPVPTRRPPPQQPQPVYSDVRDTRT